MPLSKGGDKMNTWTCTRQGELYHHGIKGQRWGIRRFQNKDGSLTPAGRRRYDEPNVGRNNKQYADKVAKKAKDMGATVSRESKSKEPKKHKIPENKSLHRLKLEEKYRNQGMSQEQAEQAAAKRIKTEALIAAAAVTTVAACVAYNKYRDFNTDKIFKENTEFQRIMRLPANAEIHDGRQYLAIDKRDKAKYKGLLGKALDTQAKAEIKIDDVARYNDPNYVGKKVQDKIYDVTVKNKNEIRVAAEKNARKVFNDMYNDDQQFRVGIKKAFKENGILFAQMNPKLTKIIDKVEKGEKLTDKELKTHAYDLFNIMLMDKTEQGAKNASKFYDGIRKAGYNAIIDVNDKKYSGYKSKMPIITIDDGFEYAKRVMGDEEINKMNKQETAKLMAPSLLQLGAGVIAYYGTTPLMNKIDMDKRVLNYKAEHPNTKMTDAEIKAMIKEEMQEDD